MSLRNVLINIFGISEVDKRTNGGCKNIVSYLVCSAVRSFLRLLANHCIIPSLRVYLFRLSGIKIGRKASVNMSVAFLDGFCPGRICLEEEVAVAPFVSLVADSHPNNSILYRKYAIHQYGKILVQQGAWLGAGCVILPGVTIGKASIIGANAVVTSDVDDYAIMAGVPARKIGDVREKKVDA
ncbi:MAG: galactoside O-acetyltransferase [Candidatus Omnitrophica bacterium CG11_big_fil_rev_8_21_14_0_20_43_6]|nr:MAG: galactoside O-acetyltransferase [Candidatus Omnitrophica bacterium CG11_big_fil_rev_8_21_14_0_20_43_6]